MPSIVVVVVPLILGFWIGGMTNLLVGALVWFGSSWVLGIVWQASRGRLRGSLRASPRFDGLPDESADNMTHMRRKVPLESGEELIKGDDMGMGAQGMSYFQGSLPTMRTEPMLTLATNRRVAIIRADGTIEISIPWDAITSYWKGEIRFPTNPPASRQGLVLFLEDSTIYAPFRSADLVVDPYDLEAWEQAVISMGKPARE